MVTHRDVARLVYAIYDYPDAERVQWARLDDGSDGDGVYWGIARLGGYWVAVFRGSSTLLDWWRDLDVRVKPTHHDELGPIHAGFYSGMRSVQRELLEFLAAAEPLPLLVGGHSLGAARATILSALLALAGRAPRARLCWGEPRAGFARLGEILRNVPGCSYRNVGSAPGEHDLVCDVPFHVPPLFAFLHPRPPTDITVTPLPNDAWGIFRYHHASLYCPATPETPV